MDIQQQYEMLKLDYMNAQHDIEKVEATGQSSETLQQRLIELEAKLSALRNQIEEL